LVHDRQTDGLNDQPGPQGARRGKALKQRQVMAIARQQGGDSKAADAGADNGNAGCHARWLPEAAHKRKRLCGGQSKRKRLQGLQRFPITLPMFSRCRIQRIIRPAA
jgi:hypothetical protein